MPLDNEQIKSLLQKQETKTLAKPPNKRAKEIDQVKTKFTRQIRRKTHYPTYPKDGPITWHDTYPPYPKLHCAARGCRTPTALKYDGIPYCNTHIIHVMVLEVADLRRLKLMRDNGSNGSYNPNDYF